MEQTDLLIQKPRGTRDFFESQLKSLDFVTSLFLDTASLFKFRQIETPLFEDTRLFLKAIGSDTDIVSKEMYELKRGDEDLNLALRPEFTAGIARAYIEHGMSAESQPVKLVSAGPVFRHERPQKGRFRDPKQLNIEIIGSQNPFYDALTILVTSVFLKKLSIDPRIVISSTGDKECRPGYNQKLKDYLSEFSEELCPDCQRRLQTNPLRVLDCKNPKCRQIFSKAPTILDSLCKNCEQHLKSLLEILDNLNIAYEIDPYLVRGLDYYTKTVFELFTKDGNLAIGGGGRYDGLLELYGAPATPGVGIGLGLDRILEAVPAKILPKYNPDPQVFLVIFGPHARKKGYKILLDLIENEISATISPDKESLGSQLRAADKSGAKYAVIIGQKESQVDQIILRDMANGQQENININKLISALKDKLSKK